MSLLGPSGSGKTTLLRAVAGLEKKPTKADRICIGNRTVCDGTPRSGIPAEERNLGFGLPVLCPVARQFSTMWPIR